MPSRNCPSCRRRIPYSIKRCVRCGWSEADGPTAKAGAGARRYVLWAAVICLTLLVGVRYADRYMPHVADWYTGFAAQHLPEGLARFAPAAGDPGALYYCARRVVKQIQEEGSVATFAGPGEAQTTTLGDGRFQVRSFVDEARQDGAAVRHEFVCIVKHERGQWQLEDLAMENQAADQSLRVNGLQIN
jgi:hypothetical protein